jgi:hypothetical protein
MCGCDLLWGILSLDTCRHHVGMVRFQADSLARWDGCLFWVRGGDVNPSCVDVCFRTTGSAFFCSAPSRFSCGARFVERRWGVRHDPAEGQSQHPKSMHGRSLVLPGSCYRGLQRSRVCGVTTLHVLKPARPAAESLQEQMHPAFAPERWAASVPSSRWLLSLVFLRTEGGGTAGR